MKECLYEFAMFNNGYINIYLSKNITNGYTNKVQPMGSLNFSQLLAYGFTIHPSHCMLESERIYNGLVDIFVTNLVEIHVVTFPLPLHTGRVE